MSLQPHFGLRVSLVASSAMIQVLAASSFGVHEPY